MYQEKRGVTWKFCTLSFFPNRTTELAGKKFFFPPATRKRLHELDVPSRTHLLSCANALRGRVKDESVDDYRKALEFQKNSRGPEIRA